jgi:hypothetical protein
MASTPPAPSCELTPAQRLQLLSAHAFTARREAVEFELKSVRAERNGDADWARTYWREGLRARAVARDIEQRTGAVR